MFPFSVDQIRKGLYIQYCSIQIANIEFEWNSIEYKQGGSNEAF